MGISTRGKKIVNPSVKYIKMKGKAFFVSLSSCLHQLGICSSGGRSKKTLRRALEIAQRSIPSKHNVSILSTDSAPLDFGISKSVSLVPKEGMLKRLKRGGREGRRGGGEEAREAISKAGRGGGGKEGS